MATFQQLDYPSWIKSPKTWDNPSLGDFELPGIVNIKPIKKMLRIEDNKASGKDGGGSIIKGLDQPDFTIELLIYTGTQEQQWSKIVQVILPTKNPKDRVAFYLRHPTLSRMQVYYCIVVGVEETPPVAGGPLTVTIYCQSVLPIKEDATKKITSKGVKKPTSPDAIDVGAGKQVGSQLHPELNVEAKPPAQNVSQSVFADKAKNPNKR